MVYDSLEPIDRPTKLMKLDDGRSNAFSVGSSNASNTNGSGLPQVFGAGSLPVNQVLKQKGKIQRNNCPKYEFLLAYVNCHIDISLSD